LHSSNLEAIKGRVLKLEPLFESVQTLDFKMSSAEKRIKEGEYKDSELKGLITAARDAMKGLEANIGERCSDLEKRMEEECTRPLGCLLQSFAHEDHL